MKNLFPFFLLLCLTFYSFGQKHKKTEEEIKTEQANEYFTYEDYEIALPYFEQLVESQPNNVSFAYKLGICYMHSNHSERALKPLMVAKEKNYIPNVDLYIEYDPFHNKYFSLDLDFNLARSYHLHHDLDKAIEMYTSVKTRFKGSFIGVSFDEGIELLDHFIYQCNNGIELMKTPEEGVTIENLGPNINTEYEEIVPLVTADENTMIFTSRRPNTTGQKVDGDNKYMEDIYIAKKVQGVWKKPSKISSKINTDDHDASVGLSPDGNHLLIYRSNHHRTGDLYQSDLSGNSWSTPIKLPSGINTRHIENSASISADEKTMVFTSSRPHGLGAEDIYIVRKDDKGNWGEVQNIGDRINTKWDEEAPFIHPNGTTLFFSSRGHNSMGGFDIFKTNYDKKTGEWSTPVNMGYPINSADDDIFFVFSPDGKRAYFSSHHEDGYGDQDIYMMNIPNGHVPVILIRGVITAQQSKLPIYAEIIVTELETSEEIAHFNSNSESGEYTVVVPPGKNYSIHIEGNGYLTHSENIFIPNTEHYYEKQIDVEMQMLQEESVVELKNLFFQNDKAQLFEESYAELDRFVEMLKENENINIEIAGHTELGGTKEHNTELSHERAQAVAKYIVNQGVKKNRVKPHGYGSGFPKNHGDTPEEKKLNRRTEIIIHDITQEGKKWEPYYYKKYGKK